MPENESLNLGDPYAKRWCLVCDHIRNGASLEEVASESARTLYSGLRKALRQIRAKGVTLGEVLRSRDDPRALQQLLRQVQGHDYLRLFCEATAAAGSTERDCLEGWIDALLDKVMHQICHRVVGTQHYPTAEKVETFAADVRERLQPVRDRLATRLGEDHDWLPRQVPRKGRRPVDATADLMGFSLLQANGK